MGTAVGTFSVDSWEQASYEEDGGAQLSRAAVTKTFRGDLIGTSSAQLLIALAQEGSRAYVGIERIKGRLEGLDGTFVVQHSATGRRGNEQLTVTVVPDSGTGGLTGLSGTMTIFVAEDGGHSYDFDYQVEA